MINSKKVLGVTLARGGSKSVPKKNIKNIVGKPLIAYTITEAIKSKYIDDYIISTDDQEIKKCSEEWGASVPFLRPQNLSTDTASSASALIHAVEFMERHNKYDYVIELMCTNPLKNVNDIDSCLEYLFDTGADTVIAVNRVYDQHPARIKKIENGLLVDFCVEEPLEARRQDLSPEAYIRSGSIYAMKKKFLFSTKARYGGNNSVPYILPDERVVNIDTMNDFHTAESIIKNSSD